MPLSGTWAEFSEIYRRQLWVGTVIRKLAGATARMPLDVWLRKGKTITAEDGPLKALLERPNDHMSGFQLKRWVSSTADIYGEAFAVKVRDSKGTPRELMPMHPRNVIVRRNSDGELIYIYSAGTSNAALLTFAWDDVISWTSYNPDNMHRGMSNLEGLRQTLLNEDASRRATASFWARGARPATILTNPKVLGDVAYARLKESWNKNYGGADNSGSTAVLEEGTTAQIVQLNMEEMQYIDSRKLNREEVCASYDVPPPVVHILDHATFSNITEQLRSQYRDTMAPRFVEYESVLQHQLVPEFYDYEEAFTNFNMDDVLRGDFEARATAVGTLIEKGVLKPSEARPMFGLDDAGPEADQLFGNAALVPLGSNAHAGQPVATDGTLMQQPVLRAIEAPKPVIRAVSRALMGRLGRVKDNKAATRSALVAEHAKELSTFFGKQRTAVQDALASKATGVFEPTEWDDELAGILGTLSTTTTQAVGTKTATDLGGTYDPARLTDWLDTDATTSAKNINATTKDKLTKRLDAGKTIPDYDASADVDDFFDEQQDGRANDIADSRVTMLVGLASLVAAELVGAASKTWIVTADNPRASHADMDGETVGLNELFSNGMNGPGDFSGGADEVAGCTCELEFILPNN
jgi:HK97 family phage portal protein